MGIEKAPKDNALRAPSNGDDRMISAKQNECPKWTFK